jgi:NAD+ kinase
VIRLGVIGNLRYEGLPAVLESLIAIAPALRITPVFEPELRELTVAGELLDDPSRIDALLTLGGDGTMLRGARLVAGRQIPVLGVNLGRLGFLTACAREDMELALERLAAGDYLVQQRMTLEAWTTRHAEPKWRALNDVVLHKGGFARVFTLRASVNGELMSTYAADGVIISSPTGSTGYSLSAGGPIVVPTVESLILTPISPHTLAIRPVVLPPHAEVSVQVDVGPDELLVTIDGQVGATFFPGDTLSVRRAERPVLVVTFRDGTFFSRMRRKLGWGGLRERDEGDAC